MKEKTVIQQLIEFNDENKHLDYFALAMMLRGKMEELLPVNEQQIINAYDEGKLSIVIDGKKYFNETYYETLN